jgi:4-amino-4-deoxy-L-arabinose transferase-like glycosyltransferase
MSRMITPSSKPVFRPRRLLAFSSESRRDASTRWAIAAILAVTLCQVLFLLVGCDWDFSGDEAEFWEWSRRLDWSYFARGPLIAWLIRLSTEVLGPISNRLTGSLMLAARFPAVGLGGLTAWGIFQLGTLTTGSTRSALWAVLLLPAIPALMIGGVLITCDTPLVCCWTWAAVWTLRALHAAPRPQKGSAPFWGAWITAGVIAGLGVLAKYTMLAFPAAAGLFMLLSRPYRRRLKEPGYWLMCCLCLVLGLTPILVWNAQHGWVGFGQLADRVGLSSRATWGGIEPVLVFFAGDFAALGGIWWVVGAVALYRAVEAVIRSDRATINTAERHRLSFQDRSGLIYLLCLWGVIWSACFAASLLGETEANWMVPAYVPLLILMGTRIERAFCSQERARTRIYLAAWCVSVAAVGAIHHTEWFFPIFARWIPPSTKGLPAPLRRIDPTCRMRGHKQLAEEVAKRVAALKAEGLSPFVLTPTYALTSTLAFYLPGQPQTYCLSWNYGMTAQPVNQHDLWHPNPRHEQAAFLGRPAVIIDDSNMPPNFANQMMEKGVFGHMDSNERIFVRERGVIIGTWDISVCRDYKGLGGYKQNPVR